MFSCPHTETTREGIADFLQLCPGAPEFWATPVFSAPSLSFENPHPGDFDGNPTLQFDVVSTSGDLTIETGSIDVNREAVPVRFELTGQATGGEFQALLGLGPEGAPDHVSFEVQYALSELNSQSLMVRSPDGSSSRGPLGEITAQIPEFIASPVLQALVESAMSSDCASGSTTETLLADLGEEPEFDSISVVFEQGNITNHPVGTWVKGSIEEVFSTTTENEEVAEFHTLLHFNHYRGVAAFLYFVGQSPVFEARHDDRTARWNAETIEWFDGSTEDASVHQFLRFPNEGIEVPDDLTPEIDAAIADWIEAFNSVLTGITTAHPQALADLQAMVADADNIEALLCVELNRAFTVADQAFQNQGTQWVAEHPEVLADEIAAQQALLTLEYLRAIDARLSRPGIDYLNGTEVTLEESNLDGITSDIEYVKVLASAGRDALAFYRDLSDLG